MSALWNESVLEFNQWSGSSGFDLERVETKQIEKQTQVPSVSHIHSFFKLHLQVIQIPGLCEWTSRMCLINYMRLKQAE